MFKNFYFFIFLFFLGCSNVSEYKNIVYKDYKTKNNFKIKNDDINTYYKSKKNLNNFFILHKTKDNIIPILHITSKEKNWVYPNKLEFISEDIFSTYFIDISENKYDNVLLFSKTTLDLKTIEKLAIPLSDSEFNTIVKYIKSIDCKIKLYSEYDNRTSYIILSDTEKKEMIKTFTLYNKLKKGEITNVN
ncbi:hypothetical protein EV215_1764 [Hypnocyclicus thermotrophus]|uniref:Lipoprotein n=1 Tax=Hypnocyclicus thermotrophus TaxID=1627895 RepID=A0AA46I511_9FUSO|nr:hypothetical protein [Hypnocyclicus thermotrophus]TDT68043.1 hypothetical protein EV215_1764 [Hypnocyclicus thermotrophus]